MGYSICRVVAAALIGAWALGSADLARASFVSVVGIEAAYCSARGQHYLDPEAFTVEEDFELLPGYCSATISPGCCWESTTVEGHPSDRSVHGVSEYICGGDMVFAALMSVSGSRVSPGLVVVSGEYLFSFSFAPPDECGSAEIALIRFAADPVAFDGLVPKTVYDFVTAGLIDEGDILFVQDEFLWLSFDEPVPFSFNVPVGGIPDDQIYLFSTLQTPLPEPSGLTMFLAGALSVYGLARIKFHWRCR
jgi:hypothetical protein